MIGRRMWVAAASAVLAVSVGACSADQAPELEPAEEGPTTTSRMLAPCPPDGPDATTPEPGCLDEDGVVQRG